jgi:hypothetical protein
MKPNKNPIVPISDRSISAPDRKAVYPIPRGTTKSSEELLVLFKRAWDNDKIEVHRPRYGNISDLDEMLSLKFDKIKEAAIKNIMKLQGPNADNLKNLVFKGINETSVLNIIDFEPPAMPDFPGFEKDRERLDKVVQDQDDEKIMAAAEKLGEERLRPINNTLEKIGGKATLLFLLSPFLTEKTFKQKLSALLEQNTKAHETRDDYGLLWEGLIQVHITVSSLNFDFGSVSPRFSIEKTIKTKDFTGKNTLEDMVGDVYQFQEPEGNFKNQWEGNKNATHAMFFTGGWFPSEKRDQQQVETAIKKYFPGATNFKFFDEFLIEYDRYRNEVFNLVTFESHRDLNKEEKGTQKKLSDLVTDLPTKDDIDFNKEMKSGEDKEIGKGFTPGEPDYG